ncbi:MAG: heparan-alpha-glucosaminide N-acetyltransferase domain-containing protein [Galactobacter sp.]
MTYPVSQPPVPGKDQRYPAGPQEPARGRGPGQAPSFDSGNGSGTGTGTGSGAGSGSGAARRRLKDFGRPPRIVALDIARGLAVIGMIAAHTLALPGRFVWTEPTTWLDIVDGRSSILFGLLAGISVALMTGRNRVPSGPELGPMRLKLLARGLLIFGIGFVLEMFGTPVAVILCFYGIIYMCAVLVIGLRVRTLLIWAASLAVAGPVAIAALTAMGDGDGLTFLLGGTYSMVVWAALMFGGLALGRLDVTRRKVAAIGLAVGVGMAGVGYTVGTVWGNAGSYDYSGGDDFSSSSSDDDWSGETVPGEDVDLSGKLCNEYSEGYVDCYPEDGDFASLDDGDSSSYYGDEDSGWFAYAPMGDGEGGLSGMFLSSSAHSGGSMEIIGSGGFALAVVCLLLLTGSALRYVLLPIAALGSMPLSAYSAHVVLLWVLSVLLGWESEAGQFWVVTGTVMVGCTVWALLAGRGPLERLSVRASRRMVDGPRTKR